MILWWRDRFINRCSYRWPSVDHARKHRCCIEPDGHNGPHKCKCGTEHDS